MIKENKIINKNSQKINHVNNLKKYRKTKNTFHRRGDNEQLSTNEPKIIKKKQNK